MEDITYPKQLHDSHPVRKRRPGEPLKRLLDRCSYEAKTGHLLAS